MHGSRDGRTLWIGVATFATVFAAWYVLTTVTHVIGGGRFPSPAEVWDALRQITVVGYADARLPTHILQSAKLVLLGFGAAVCVGVPLGLAMGWSRSVEAFVNPAFLLIRPIPPLAWIPLAIVWLGLGDAAKILVMWLRTVFTLRPSLVAIALVELPSAISCRISRWRGVSRSSGLGSAPARRT